MPDSREFTEVVVTRGRLCGWCTRAQSQGRTCSMWRGQEISVDGSLSCTHCVFHEIRRRAICRQRLERTVGAGRHSATTSVEGVKKGVVGVGQESGVPALA